MILNNAEMKIEENCNDTCKVSLRKRVLLRYKIKRRKTLRHCVMSYNARCAPFASDGCPRKRKVIGARTPFIKHPAKQRGVLNPVYLAFTILALEISPFLSKKYKYPFSFLIPHFSTFFGLPPFLRPLAICTRAISPSLSM